MSKSFFDPDEFTQDHLEYYGETLRVRGYLMRLVTDLSMRTFITSILAAVAVTCWFGVALLAGYVAHSLIMDWKFIFIFCGWIIITFVCSVLLYASFMKHNTIEVLNSKDEDTNG